MVLHVKPQFFIEFALNRPAAKQEAETNEQIAEHNAPPRAVSQLLWPDRDREVWFSLEENHEKAYRFPDFLQRGTSWEK
jgi:predicted NUDIX family NTP pyrophosphohydrolase